MITIAGLMTFIFGLAILISAIAILGFLLLVPYFVWQIKRDVAEIRMRGKS